MLHPEHLLTAYDCGPLHLRNRLTAAPIVTGYEHFGEVKLLKNLLTEYARDGVSMITVAAGIVHSSGRPFRNMLVFSESRARQHKVITDQLHQENCHAILQLIHAGPQADVLFPISSRQQLSPKTGRRAHGANNYTLRKLIAAYAKTARYSVLAGYDGVEILASGLCLPAVFLSPAMNDRKDAWGTNQLGRFKLSLDIVRAVRKELGPEKAIGFRFNLLELSPNGSDWDETLRFIQMLRIAGVDYLCADFGGIEDRIPGQSFDMPNGVWNSDYEALAENTELTVIFGHGFGRLEQADKLAQKHHNALFELSDELLGDTGYIHKCLGLSQEAVIPWISIQNEEIYNDIFRTKPVFNLVNPFNILKSPKFFEPAVNQKKFVVVGAGPAGIYFSLVAAYRGHQVQLIEQNDRIGGSLWSLQKILQSEDILSWIKILEDKIKLSTIDLKLGTKATKTEILQLKDIDRFVLATGIEPDILDISGIDSSNVMTFDEMLENNLPVGKRVAVIGATSMSLSVCRYLLGKNKEKTLAPDAWRKAWGIGNIKENAGGVLGFIPEIEPSSRLVYLMETKRGQISYLLKDTTDKTRIWKYKWLLMNGLHTLDDINIEAIDNYSVRVSSGDRHTDRFTVRIDHVVICADVSPSDELSEQLSYHNREQLFIGSASLPQDQLSLKTVIQKAVELASRI